MKSCTVVILFYIGSIFVFHDCYGFPTSKLNDDPADWDYFLFTQMWPQSACIEDENENHDCVIPDNTTTWTVHGLWPNKLNEQGPNFCNKSDKFDVSKVLPLEGKLLKYWPNMLAGKAKESFWKHEWEKHGTCAESVPALAGEYNYFNMGLQLNQKYDFLSLLKSKQIVPDEKATYKAEDIIAAVNETIQKHALIRCTYQHSDKTHHLMSIEMCFDKSISLIDCPRPQQFSATELCPDTKPIHYTPITHDHNRKRDLKFEPHMNLGPFQIL